MLTKTSLSAIRMLLHLARGERGAVVPPKRIAEDIGESPTYLAKTARVLVKAGILRAAKGIKGGVQLNRPPAGVTLLAIIEACQGTIVGDYCLPDCRPGTACAYHQAAVELHGAIVGVLSRWNLSHLVERPAPVRKGRSKAIPCMLVNPGGER